MATFAAPMPLIPPFGCPPRRTSRNLPRIEISGCLTDESHLQSRLYKCFVCNQITFRDCAFHLRSGKAVANDPSSQPCASAGRPASLPFLCPFGVPLGKQGEQAAAENGAKYTPRSYRLEIEMWCILCELAHGLISLGDQRRAARGDAGASSRVSHGRLGPASYPLRNGKAA